MITAGVLYVLVALSTSLIVPVDKFADSAGALLVVVEEGPLAVPAEVFAAIALVAVTNTCLVALVTQSRILYGMAREDVVPRGSSSMDSSSSRRSSCAQSR